MKSVFSNYEFLKAWTRVEEFKDTKSRTGFSRDSLSCGLEESRGKKLLLGPKCLIKIN